ncbi:MAG: hypothetical protein ACK50B_15795 [Betaproteobacteria bacterium]|jgi:hypothetical protein
MPWQRVDTEPLDIDTGVAPASARAIAAAVLRRTLPLLVRRDGRAEPLATGTLYRIAGRTLLVTCRHLFDAAVGLGDLLVPLPRAQRLLPLHPLGRRVVVHPERDLALIELARAPACDALLREWPPVPIDASALDDDGGMAVPMYVLAGWPYEQMRRVDETVFARPVVVFAARRPGPAAADLRLSYARVARRSDGVDVHAPALDGVSGATVWQVLPAGGDDGSGGGLLLRPAAVQCAFKHDAYARAEALAQARGLVERVCR